jgi:anti-sigma B factor antagonist
MATIDDAPVTFSVTREDRDDVTVLLVAGELDMSTAPQLSDRVDEALADGRKRLRVDLTDLTFCDSTGMSAFVRGHYRCEEAGGWLRLTGARGTVARVLSISGLDALLGDDAAG